MYRLGPCLSTPVPAATTREWDSLVVRRVVAVRAGCGRSIALGEQWSDGRGAVGEQLAEGPRHEARGAEDIGNVGIVVQGIEGRDAPALRSGIQFLDAASRVDDEAEARDDGAAQASESVIGRPRYGLDTQRMCRRSSEIGQARVFPAGGGCARARFPQPYPAPGDRDCRRGVCIPGYMAVIFLTGSFRVRLCNLTQQPASL